MNRGTPDLGTCFLLGCCLLLSGAVSASAQSEKYHFGPVCNCYWDADCNTISFPWDCTGYGECYEDGKLDGTCLDILAESQASQASQAKFEAEPEEIAAAVDFYFRAYAKAARRGGGRADAKLFSQAETMWLGTHGRQLHSVLQAAVNEALDATLGFDFSFPALLCHEKRQLGNIRMVPPGAVDLIHALRTGFENGILLRDPTAVAGPLAEFWRRHPGYEPYHTGRYYPHGHAGESTDPQPVQREALKMILSRLLARM